MLIVMRIPRTVVMRESALERDFVADHQRWNRIPKTG